MAFDSTTFFTNLGKIVKYINSRLATATTTLPAELKAIADLYEAADTTAIITGLYGVYAGFQSNVAGERRSLAAFADATLLDRDTVLEQLPSLAADVQSVLSQLHQWMLDNSVTVNRSTVTLGSTTAGSGNNGTGVVLTTKVLDGYNPPVSGGQANLRYNALNSELCVGSESMRLTCSADSMRDGTSEGAEQFTWEGGVASDVLDWQDEGSGQGPTITVANASTLVTDGDLENWGGTGNNTPSNWTIDNGTAGTHVFRESTNFYRGTYGCKLLGTGAQATIGLGQAISPSTLQSRRRYCLALRLKGSAVPAAGQFEFHFSGTGYSKTSPVPEVQTLQISGTPTGGTYTISWVGPFGGTQTTAAIAYNASSATVQAALRLLAGLECVVVTTSAGSPPDVTHTITFRGVQGDVSAITCSIASLTGGSPVRTIATTTPGVEGDCVVLPAAAIPTGWFLAYFWINLPSVIPSDWRMVFQAASTLSNTVALYVDSLAAKAVDYFGGLGVAVEAGSTRFVAGDRFTWTVANSEGVFAKFARQWWKFQLPSSVSPSLADALAT